MTNRILYAEDCLDVLNDEIALQTDSVDLIYLDPPFNSKSNYNLPFKGKYKNAKPAEAFKDTWTWGEKEEENLEKLDSGPATRYLANIIRLSQDLTEKSGGGEACKHSCLSDQHGSPVDSDEAGTERHWKHISSL